METGNLKLSGPGTKRADAAQDYPLEPAPAHARQGFWSLTVVLTGFTFFTATMFAGGNIGPAFRFFPDLLLVILVGNLLLGGYAAVLGWIAAKTGLNTALLSRFSFGNIGSKLPDFLLGFTQVGWYAWGTATMAIALIELTGIPAGWRIPLMIIFGFGFCATAWIGYRGLDLLSKVAVPLMIIVLAVSFGIAFADAGKKGGLLELEAVKTLPVTTALTMIVGTFVSGATQATNWSRFAKDGKSAVLTTLLAFFVGNGLMVFSGALTGLVYQEPDIVNVLKIQGLVSVGIAMLFLNIWSTQDNTIYNFSVSGCNFLRTGNRRAITLVGAAIGTLLAIGGMYEWLIPYLVFLGKIIPPIGGVLIADYVARRGKYAPIESGSLPAYNLVGLVSYAVGAGAGFLPFGVAPVNAIVAALLVYFAGAKALQISFATEAESEPGV